MITPNIFIEHFEEEVKQTTSLQVYYKFVTPPSRVAFRKAYVLQRLKYIADNIVGKHLSIWDCGCGYGTTGIYLSLNGHSVYGSTIEFFFDEIPQRYKYWEKFGNPRLFEPHYENIFDKQHAPESVDIIILQDTLHHLEPMDEALDILYSTLKPGGKIIIVEINGNCFFERTKFFMQRGNKRIISIWDERLKKNIFLGNENIRTFKQWKNKFEQKGFLLNPKDINYIRFYPPYSYRNKSVLEIISKEQQIWKKNAFIRNYFFFGLNMIISKSLK